MTDPMLRLAGLSPLGGKAVAANFDGGCCRRTAALALWEVERRLGVADCLIVCRLSESRSQGPGRRFDVVAAFLRDCPLRAFALVPSSCSARLTTRAAVTDDWVAGGR
jgi:hypothetical protein